MDPEWPLAGRGIHDAHDPVSDLRRVGVGVGGRQLGESGVDPVDEAAVVVLVVRCALLSAGPPARLKWFVPEANAPGTMIVVSMPKRISSAA